MSTYFDDYPSERLSKTRSMLTLPRQDPFPDLPVTIKAVSCDVQVVGRGVNVVVKKGMRLVLPPE